MAIEVRNVRDPRVTKQQEYAASEQERQAGLLEYVAMMADIELPYDESEDSENE